MSAAKTKEELVAISAFELQDTLDRIIATRFSNGRGGFDAEMTMLVVSFFAALQVAMMRGHRHDLDQTQKQIDSEAEAFIASLRAQIVAMDAHLAKGMAGESDVERVAWKQLARAVRRSS